MGLEPTTFELEVQCANPLRHRDLIEVGFYVIYIHTVCVDCTTYCSGNNQNPLFLALGKDMYLNQ